MRRLSEIHDVNDERPDGPLFGFSKYRFSLSVHVFHASAKLLETSVPDHIPNSPISQNLYKMPPAVKSLAESLSGYPNPIPPSLQNHSFATVLPLDSVVVTPSTLLVDPLSGLHILALLFKSNRIASLVPHGTAASVPESLQALLVLGALEDLFHFQVRDGAKDSLGVDELLLREQVAQRRRSDPGRSAEATSSLVFIVVLVLAVGHDLWKSDVVAVGVHWRGLGRFGRFGHGFGVWNSGRCLELARGAVLIALVGLGLLIVLRSRWVGVLGEWNACTTMLHGLAGMSRSLSVLQLMLVVHGGLEYAAACVVRSRRRSV